MPNASGPSRFIDGLGSLAVSFRETWFKESTMIEPTTQTDG